MPKVLSSYEQKLRAEKFNQGLLWCNHCHKFLPIDSFYKLSNQASNFGYRFYCKKCEYSKRKDKHSVYFAERNQELKNKFVELAGGSCHRCGYDEFNASLEFHHIYRSTKEIDPGIVIYSKNFKKAWKELDKCCLLCKNCHASYEAGRWRVRFIKRDGLGWMIGETLPLDDTTYNEEPDEMETIEIPSELIEVEPMQLELMT